MRNIVIRFKNQKDLRYDTWGDWFYDEDKNLIIEVINDHPDVDTSNKMFLIALHELIEVILCEQNNVTQAMVDDFDFKYTGDGEPGDEVDAPYRKEHRQAMIIEHMMANFLKLDTYGTIR